MLLSKECTLYSKKILIGKIQETKPPKEKKKMIGLDYLGKKLIISLIKYSSWAKLIHRDNTDLFKVLRENNFESKIQC